MGNFISRDPEQEYEKSQYQRELAKEYHRQRVECIKTSQEAYHRRDHKKAKQLSANGKRYQELTDEANKRAADAIFNYLNAPGRIPENSIDLHGLHVNEALERLKKRIRRCNNQNIKELIVIVGQGNHSADGPKIKPAVLQYAATDKIRHRPNTPNPGCILFEFDEVSVIVRIFNYFRDLF